MKLLLLWLLFGCAGGLGAQEQTPPHTCYLFSYFVDNGEDGLHLAWSRDGLKWKALRGGKSVLHSSIQERIIRDPCLLLGPDGVFRLVWTDSWKGGSIGYASSPDLRHWSAPREIPVMASFPGTRNAWAPEVHYDAAAHDYLIFWSSTVPGAFMQTAATSEDGYNHRIYMTRTRDFVSFSPTRLFLDPGFSCIDATILPALGRFYLIFKNETLRPSPQKNLWLASSRAMDGPYEKITGPLPTRPPQWVEGPTALQVGARYVVYYDCYAHGHFGAMASRDLKTWTNLTSQLSMPPGIRHGTILAVPERIVARWLKEN